VSRDAPGYAEIINLYGLFGAGKSTLLRLLRSRIEQDRLADALFVTGEDIDTSTIPEFVYQLASGYHALDPAVPRLMGEETEARRRRYLQIIGSLPADARPMLAEIERSAPLADGQYGERQLDADIFAFEVAVRNQFNNVDDQRLTLDTGNVMAEAFIVDLVNTFFPINEEFPSLDTYLEKGLPPRRIIIAIDTYEKITPLVNPWLLESLLPYLYQKRFGDFQSYRSPFIPDTIQVRQFIDARFIIAGRERLTLTDQERRWDRYRESLREIRVALFTRDEVTAYLKGMGIADAGVVDTVIDQTHGLPYLVALWVDAARAEEEGTERTTINALAQQRIFWYKTPEQREWIRAAAFLDWFDVDALRCFETIGEGAERAFDYLRSASEVAGPSRAREGKFEVHEIIRRALRQATEQESGERADEFSEAASAFYGASELLARFNPLDKKLLRRLAYFSRFDEAALQNYFGGEAHLVRDLVDSSPDLFEKGRFTTSLAAEAAGRLKRYNRYAERKIYQQRLDELQRLWQERAAELEQQRGEMRLQVIALESELRARQSEQLLKSDLQKRAALGVGDLDSELHTARKRWSRSLSPKDAMVARTSFFFMVVMFVVVFFADLLPVDEGMQGIIRTAALGLFALFLVTFSLMLGRIFYMRSRRVEHQSLREDVASVEGRLISRQREFHELGAEAERVEGEIKALAERIDALNIAIEEAGLRLKEPYI
jgi:hypothetical protein